MTGPASRRGFLRGLTTLPLIGGGVALIGAPSAVAEPVTHELLDSYDAWLEYERRCLQFERYANRDMFHRLHLPFVHQMFRHGRPEGESSSADYIPADNNGALWHFRGEPAPSTRAALVLSTVGCDWREASR